MKGFPHKNWLGLEKGWKDLGRVEWSEIMQRHDFCGTIAHVGKEQGELFKFCPRCLVKLKNYI